MLLIELGVRMIGYYLPQSTPYMSYYDADVGVIRMTPNYDGKQHTLEHPFAVHSNKYGFRDVDRNLTSTKTRIILVGDSFAFGYVDFEDTISQQLERMYGGEVEVLNMGYYGYEPREYYRLIENVAVNFNPDIIVNTFFLGNDIRMTNDSMRNEIPTYYKGYLVGDQNTDSALFKLKFFLRVHVKSTFLYKNIIASIPGMQPVLEKLGISAPLQRDGYLVPEKSIYANNLSTEISKQYDYSLSYFSRIQDIATEQDIDYVVVMIPSKFTIDPEQYIMQYLPDKDFNAMNLFFASHLDFRKPHKVSAAYFKENNIRYVDTLPELSQREIEETYWVIDGHLTAEGNRIVAQKIYKYLSEEAIV
ncbi:MAG: SGNH/GDSL hydrolase family protein [Candidatus Woesearchaeota archaeon]|nr:MAG: SGNH/GDSL hydrolase family protein [Candidatus Woesearchaeota archaeon]